MFEAAWPSVSTAASPLQPTSADIANTATINATSSFIGSLLNDAIGFGGSRTAAPGGSSNERTNFENRRTSRTRGRTPRGGRPRVSPRICKPWDRLARGADPAVRLLDLGLAAHEAGADHGRHH